MKTARQKYTPIIAGLAFVIFFGILQNLVKNFHYEKAAEIREKAEFIGLSIDPRIVRRLLGTRVLVADLIWIDTLIKSDLVREGQFTTMYRAAKTMLQLDPENYYGYYVMGLYLSVIKDDIKGATEILRQGALDLQGKMNAGGTFSKNFLEVGWRVYFALGFNLLFEEISIEEGSKWIREAAKVEESPQYLKALAQRVSTEGGRLEVASRILTDLYRRAKRPEEKKRIEEKLLSIAVKQELVDLNDRFQIFLTTTGAYSQPKKKAFGMFLRSIHHSGRDTVGNLLALDSLGKITSPASTQSTGARQF